MTPPNLKRSARGLWMPILVIAALLLLIWGVRVLGAVNRLQADVRGLSGMKPEEALAAPSAETDALFTQMAQDLQDLRGSAGPLLDVLPSLGWLPRYGGDLANAPALLDFGDKTVRAARDTLALGRALSDGMKAGRVEKVPAGVSVLKTVQSQAALVERAQQSLKVASAARQAIDPAGLSSSPRELLNRFDRWLPLWQTGVEVLADAPALLGADRPRTYLLIAQNSDELRATGGFVSAVALLRIDRGVITTTGFQDSYAVDDLTKIHPEAPKPLYRYMYAWQWMFRDTNWSPDVPTSARQLIRSYAIDRGTVADGVIAVNLQAVPTLLQALGALDLKSENISVNAENVVSKIEENWSSPEIAQGQPTDWWSNRKDFLGDLFQTALSRVLSGEFDQGELLRGFSAAAAREDLWFFLEADGKQREVLFPSDSALAQGSGDTLMLVDSNVGFNKVDSRVNRAIEYTVHIESSGAARSTTTITYTNTSPDTGTFCVHEPLYATTYAEMQQGCYWDYLRVVAPPASQLTLSTGVSEAAQVDSEAGRSVFGGYLILPRGETQEVVFTYHQPGVMNEGMVYSLHLERQPGAPVIPATVRVTWPAEWQVRSANPAPERETADTLDYAVTLDRDQTFLIAFDQGGSPLAQAIPFEGLVVATLGVVAYYLLRLNHH